MTPPDTSRQAVERLAAALEAHDEQITSGRIAIIPDIAPIVARVAAMLRALLDRAERAEAERDEERRARLIYEADMQAVEDERDAERQLRIMLEKQRDEANAYGDAEHRRAEAAEGVLRGPPDTPPEITRISWLWSLLDDARRRGPPDDCTDPDAWWEMIEEVSLLHDDGRAALAAREGGENG